MSIAALRKEYRQAELRREQLNPDPLRQFQKWFQDALDRQLPEPSAMALATADLAGRPSVRVVLLKGADHHGFSFFTNYESRKGKELEANPQAAVVFYWAELERQVRLVGSVTKLSREVSEAYFGSRPKGSRLAAWASKQSQPVSDRNALEREFDRLAEQYPDDEVPLPPIWGGYLLQPAEFEFWQGRPDRLHDRFRYTRQPDETWMIERLSP